VEPNISENLLFPIIHIDISYICVNIIHFDFFRIFYKSIKFFTHTHFIRSFSSNYVKICVASDDEVIVT